jgi:hypothetical protein
MMLEITSHDADKVNLATAPLLGAMALAVNEQHRADSVFRLLAPMRQDQTACCLHPAMS